jgi:hypothetical protein
MSWESVYVCVRGREIMKKRRERELKGERGEMEVVEVQWSVWNVKHICEC